MKNPPTDVSSGVVVFTFKWERADREAGGGKLSPPTTRRDGALRPGREGGGHRATFILDGAAAADPIYRDAIRASMNKLGIAEAKRDAYVSQRPTLTASNALESIITQKYIANFLIVSAYNDWRRTGYPELDIINDPVIDNIPLRFVPPNSELDNNLENLKATGIPLGQEAMSVPVWWDSK